MLVEGDTLVALDLIDALEKAGFQVLGPFMKEADALRSLEKESPTLAILDPLLKEGLCVDLAGKLRSRGIPFLVHSGLQEHQPPASGFRGVPWYNKPALPSDVVHSAKELALSLTTYARDPKGPDLIPASQGGISTGLSDNPFIRKLESLAPLSDADRTMLERISGKPCSVPAHTDLVREGDKPDGVFLVMEGFVCRQKHQSNGLSQIMAYLLPGDFCDLDVALLDEMDHTLTTVSSCQIVHLTPETIAELMHYPGIARALRMTTLVDEATLREWLVNIGCRSALSRMAHLFCELLTRMKAVGHAVEDSCILPLTQAALGNTTGITTVHVNRTLQAMREQGLITFKKGRLTVLDLPRLKKIATFRPNYLHLGRRFAA
ncbi:helix-turn-helix domain-containing protein [Methylobacterium sp. CM6247]